MEINEAIKNIKMFHFKNLPRFKPELINLLKSLESENKKLKKENEAYKGMWKSLIALENKLKKQFGLR